MSTLMQLSVTTESGTRFNLFANKSHLHFKNGFFSLAGNTIGTSLHIKHLRNAKEISMVFKGKSYLLPMTLITKCLIKGCEFFINGESPNLISLEK